MNPQNVRIQFVRTLYPHWGKYSGIHQFVKYLDKSRFKSAILVASDNDDDFPIRNVFIRSVLKVWLQSGGMKWYKLSDLVAEWKILQKCCRGEVDLIHYLDGEHSAQFLPKFRHLLKKRNPTLKIIASFHQPPEILKDLINVENIPLLDGVVVVAPNQIPFFKKFLNESQIHLILHGIDTDFFSPGRCVKPTSRIRCLTVGKYLRDLDVLRKVAKDLKEYPEIEFHLVSPDHFDTCESGNIFFHTGLDDNSLRNLYQNSDILFLPLLDATANNALLEGMSCGLPIISTDIPAVKAYISEKTSILIKNNNYVDFSAAILHLFNNPSIKKEMGVKSRLRAKEVSWSRMAKSYEELYLSQLQD